MVVPNRSVRESYREFVERNTHPGSVALEIAPLEAIVDPNEERSSRIVVKSKYIVALVAAAFVKGTLEIKVNLLCSESDIERVAKAQSGRVTCTIDGTVRVERIGLLETYQSNRLARGVRQLVMTGFPSCI